ncbi:flagellar basal body rod protein [Virgibacillus profundi]|uniref:Flagellar basal body rod protein n=1 Tax=Virgibacillus profundi TaxID=2024555 RepID=A0A2A2IA86_9BACI|nr:flagellar basal body rod protein [Virgibacillus profundi]PAV28639.1 flagellar basal body rod protein [Virgibacillus profundi]PXY52807.1 flagellar basal body rod protein [Virgibacillus profundi]
MKKFMLFVGGLIALFILLANLGPMILLGLSIWLLYVIFKKFVKSDSTSGKIGWVILGLIVLSITFSNIFAVIGVAAAYVLYLIFTSWKKDDSDPVVYEMDDDDPFKNFERQWAEINN